MKKDKNIISFNSAVTTSIFALSFLVIGIPLWWKTTEVYRYPIPYQECQGLLSEKIRHTIPIKLLIEDRTVKQGLLWEELLNYSGDKTKESSQLVITFDWSMSSTSEEEQELIQSFQSITDLDSALYLNPGSSPLQLKEYGKPEIIILNQNYSKEPKFTIGRGRHGYIINNEGIKGLVQSIDALARQITQVNRLQKLYTPASSYGGDKKPDKDRMRYLRSSKKFDMTFSLIVPEPQVLEAHWNIEKAINSYLTDVLKELELISTVNVKSQVLYMTSLPISTRSTMGDKGEEFILHSDHLPSLINPIEAKLGSDTSVHPNLNFVLYIPTREQTPLQIYDNKDKPLPSNAFLLPQWGGFMIYNCHLPKNASLPHPILLDSHAFMEVFLSQFRLLLGLAEADSLSSDTLQVLSGPVIRKWEVDFLLRKNAQEQLSVSISSLSSLSQLLQTIGNIVIRDDVGKKIHSALSSTKESLEFLAKGDLLKGFLTAQSAFVFSDEAFFDPSLLALLYFPEDQKYAIYIPLFLPISLPVITSLSQLWKYWRHTRTKDKTKCD
ncbi:GPI transamidase component PIG-S-like [Argiope bruennichi]|uniref:GPI transamidase component PIG-S-like n=1 Tax=Argiope bruennichi TaxID=94029 RepID=UPI00249545E6|nr:GPI transamidase component PIG-S-like [Argiope bruennichi]